MRLFRDATEYDMLIGCHQNFHGVYAALAGAFRDVPVVQLVINSLDWVDKVPLGRWALGRARAVGFRGYTSMRRFREETGPVPTSFVIHNVWTPGPAAAGETGRDIDLLYVGHGARAKNLDLWLEVAAAVKRRLGRLRALWVGELPPRKFARRIKRLGLEKDLVVLGPRDGDALDDLYLRAKVLLLTSRREGLPMVAVEAMAHGVPVVAPRVGDVEDIVRSSETGFLTAPQDAGEAADGVCRLLSDPPLRHRLGSGARDAFRALAAQSTLEYTTSVWRDLLRGIDLVPPAVSASVETPRSP
jgi:glycosyltransferase involved in cell wall biosynthesis